MQTLCATVRASTHPTCAARVSAVALALLLGACASTPNATDSGSAAASTGSSQSALAVATTDPIAAAHATIAVAGLACPKCASNVDVQLVRIPGVRVSNIAMKNGLVHVQFNQQPHPSPARLGRAVEDAGLTFLGVADEGTPFVPALPANPLLSGR